MQILNSLTSELPIIKSAGDSGISITGINFDSRKIDKGNLFVAVVGLQSDGHDYISEAVNKGAVAVVGEKEIDPKGKYTYIKVKDSREALGILASNWFGNPSQKLKVIGVTGTKGKTTTVHIIYHLLTNLGKKAGLISSIAAKFGNREEDTGFHVTNPDSLALHGYLKEMTDAGAEYAVIEVSSHGIDQKRIAGVKFEAGVLTNIAPEHLDYHKTFAEYKRVKMSFINSCSIKIIAPKATEINTLPGYFNNINAAAAIELIEKLGLDSNKSLNYLNSFKLPEGRLEEIETKSGVKIIIDFAHTTDSLLAVLKHINSLPHKRIISVFGCASERDPGKRSGMARVSSKLSDVSIFTVEDSRYEDIFNIFKPMVKAAGRLNKKRNKDFYTVPERGEAIALALSMAQKGDIVGIFGKGHEKSLAYKGFEHPWSDHESVRNFINRNETVSAIVLAAGKGTRMKSDKPKILHEICGRPMIAYSLANLRDSGVGEIVAVLSFKRNLVRPRINGAVKIAVQENPKGGTGDAAYAGLKKVSDKAEDVMILYGDDTAFYSPKTIKSVLELHKNEKAVITFITLIKEDPKGLGRILRDINGNVTGIIEEKDASDLERKINEVNDGLYVFDKKWLSVKLPQIHKSSVTGEVYLVELIKMAIEDGKKVIAKKLPDSSEWQGVNTPEELLKAEEKMRHKLLQ
jgi:UDP-N-acetylmuramoyl-L-alanyl-D-glutamate--2,6-diaminopimelate ligase